MNSKDQEATNSMFKLVHAGTPAHIYCEGSESAAIHRAIGDLCGDLVRIGAEPPTVKRYLPVAEQGCLVIGSLPNEKFRGFAASQDIDLGALAGEWERYAIVSFGEQHQHLLIAGSDDRGTMWGIYELCRSYLGVDPLYLWTDQLPARQSEIVIPPVRMVSQPPTFQFRGWFLNDEDLLSEWLPDGGSRSIDYPFYGQVIHPRVLDRVIETALRLKQNLLIPASFVDIFNPAEEGLVRQVTERGLYISQHHVEPMGVSHFAWDRYWQQRGLDFPASYVRHPERFEEIWTDYAKRWAQYPQVIWQLGLRGRADKPVWVSDPAAPASMADRGKLISDALMHQHRIIRQLLGEQPFYATATLWMEGTQLHHEGHLVFPPGTMPVFADYGPSQMLGEDFHETERKPGHAYGVYYHTAFWPCGPHLVQGNPPEKIARNYKQIVAKGDTAYSILNVANIREVVLGVQLVADMTWSFTAFELQRHVDAWCRRQFGERCAAQVSQLYARLYAAYHVVEHTSAGGHVLLLDGVLKLLGLKLIEMKEDFSRRGWFEETYYAFDSYDEMIASYEQVIRVGLRKWKSLHSEACRLLDHIPEERRSFYICHFIVQIECGIALHAWLHSLLLARREWLREGAGERFRAQVGEAVYALERWLYERKKAETGQWSGWYNGEKKLGMQELLGRTQALLGRTQALLGQT